MGENDYRHRFDTTLTVLFTARAEKPLLIPQSYQYAFGKVSLCGGEKDTLITLRNRGCDTLDITSGPGMLPQEYTIEGLTLPYSLPPDSTITLRVKFRPRTAGRIGANPKFTARQQGLSQEIEILLDGEGVAEGSELVYEPKRFEFPMRSICASGDTLTGFITNTGCDTLFVDNGSYIGDADLGGVIPSGSVAPGDTIRYNVTFTPLQKSKRFGQIILAVHDKLSSRRDTIPIEGEVSDGTKLLTVHPTTINFGRTTMCEERDSFVVITNTGCDTVTISDMNLLGIGFTGDLTLPIRLAPNETLRINISTKQDTTAPNNATLTIASNAENTLQAVTMSRSYELPKQYGMHLALLTSTETAGSIVRLAVVGEQGLGRTGSGISELTFDLTLDEDLLHFIRTESPNQIIKNGSRITIRNNELNSIDDTLVTFVYQVHLTKASATDIILSNVSIGDTSACAPKVLGSGNGLFTYRYECGDSLIQTFMRGEKLPLRIISLRPNPARDEINIDVSSAERTPVTLTIYDRIGKQVYNSETTVSGTSTLRLPVKQYPDGLYLLRLTTPNSWTTTKFVKE
jgi:hypothetical protein